MICSPSSYGSVDQLVEREVLRSRLFAPKASSAPPKDEYRPGDTPAPPRQWTVLAYINGNGGTLQRLAPGVMRELEVAGSSDEVNIVAQMSRQPFVLDRFTHDWSGTRRYIVARNPEPPGLQEEMIRYFVPPYTKNIVSPVFKDMGPVDMASPETFQDFLKWGIEKFPAEHYLVLVYGQGGGFVGPLMDEKTGHVLGTPDLAASLQVAADRAGHKIDVVALDAAMMGQVEVADALAGSTKILVAPEGTVSMGSIPLDAVMKDLAFESREKPQTPEDLARWFVFEARYQPAQLAELTLPALSAVDLEKLVPLKNAWASLSSTLASAVEQDGSLKEPLRAVMDRTQSLAGKSGAEPYKDFRDLGHFCEELQADSRFAQLPGVAEACQSVRDRLKDSFVDEFHARSLEHATGLSTYMPTDFGYDMPATPWYPKGFDPTHGYDDLPFGPETGWNEVLRDVAKDTALHETLRRMGASDEAIHTLEVLGQGGAAAAKMALNVAKRAGHYEASRAMRGQEPGGFMGMPADIATKVGAVGGGYEAFRGAEQVFRAATSDEVTNRGTMAVDGVADTLTGAAVVATVIGMTVAEASGIAKPAAIAAFAIPIAKTVFDFWAARQGAAKAREHATGFTPQQRLADLPRKEQDEKSPYISPIVRAAAEGASAGPVDLARQKE